MNAPTLPEGVVTGAVRVWLRAEGLLVLALSVFLYFRLDGHWWIFAALLLVPDLSMLGYLINTRIGSICYNIVHSYVIPLGLAIVALAEHRSGIVALLCIWTAHIGMDRAFGYGLKYGTAFRATHLGIAGRVAS